MPVEPTRYTLESSQHERDRLTRQAAGLRPLTERLFRAAGIGPGSRVLDVGSGAGDVAMSAALLVGESGEVVGIDRDPTNLGTAAARCSAAGLANVRFVVADLNDPPPGPFDAIVGRVVLQYQPDPAASVRTLTRELVPGGVVAFVEICSARGAATLGALTWPEDPLVNSVHAWVHDAFAATGVTPNMGVRLPSTFRSAGLTLEDPPEAVSVFYMGREAADIYAGLVRSLLPVLTQHGIATPEQVDIDTLADRLQAIAGHEELVVLYPPAVAAWARKPPAN